MEASVVNWQGLTLQDDRAQSVWLILCKHLCACVHERMNGEKRETRFSIAMFYNFRL